MDSLDYFIFYQSEMMSSAFSVFCDMREKGELIDFQFSVANQSFSGHRVVLAAAIPHFRSVFTNSQEEMILEGIDPTILPCLVDFAYTGKIKISLKNARSLLLASKYLNMIQLNKACCEFLDKYLHVDNIWQFRTFAETHACAELIQISDHFIRQNFEEFSKSKSFEALPFLYLKETVSRHDLEVKSEEHVYEAIIQWVTAASDERKDYLSDLLELARMPRLSPGSLTRSDYREEIIRNSLLSRDLVNEAKQYRKMFGKNTEDRSFNDRPRICEKKSLTVTDITANTDNLGMYVICESKRKISMKSLDMGSNKLEQLSVHENGKISVNVVAALNEMIYIFRENTILTFDVKKLMWSTMEVFHESLLFSGAVLHHKKIYFFGGVHSTPPKIRCFSPLLNKWENEGKMLRPLLRSGVASLKHFIYVTGGSYGGEIYKSVDRYEPKTTKWTQVSPMLSERTGHGCTCLNGKIYVCGGLSYEYRWYATEKDTTEVYDATTNKWSFVSSMKIPLWSIEVVPNNGKIYAMQNNQPSDFNCALQVYDPELDEWEFCILSDDPKFHDYSCAFLVSAPIPTY